MLITVTLLHDYDRFFLGWRMIGFLFIFCNRKLFFVLLSTAELLCVNNVTMSSKISERERNNHVDADMFSPSGDSAMRLIVCLHENFYYNKCRVVTFRFTELFLFLVLSSSNLYFLPTHRPLYSFYC